MAELSARRAKAIAGAAGAAIALAACGGSSTPHVATLAQSTGNNGAPSTGASPAQSTTTNGGISTAGSPNGNPTALLNEWATCMHSHGDPNQVDPTVDAYGVINIVIPASGSVQLSNEVHAGADPCNHDMAATEAALRAANPVAPPPDQAELIKYTDCMRANGVPNDPYPSANMTFQGTGVDPNSPSVIRVNNLCGRKLNLPAWWVSGNGEPGEVSVSNVGPNGSSNPGNPPPCFYQTSGCPKGARGGNLPARGGNSGAAAGG